MENQFTYRIVNLWPKPHTGGYNFGIELDPDFARKARALRFNERSVSALENFAQECVMASFGHSAMREVGIQLDGGLLTNINIPGNACGLDIKDRYPHDDPEKPAFYCSHNVDSTAHAFCLIAIFTDWEEVVQAGIRCNEHGFWS